MSVEDELSMGEATPVKKQDDAVEDAELSLSEVAVDEVLAKRDADRAIKGFDLRAWIDGVRSARTTVRLYSRPDLDVHIQRTVAELDEARQLGVMSLVKERQRKLVELKREYFAHSLDVVLEERSKEWQARQTRRFQDAGVTGSRALTLHLVASQIVEPAGEFTGEDLVELSEIIPSQVRGLVDAWGQISGVPAKDLPVF